MKARLYRMLPVLALLAVVVEGLGAGVVVLGMAYPRADGGARP